MVKASLTVLTMLSMGCFALAQGAELISTPEKDRMVEALYGAAVALPKEKRDRAERAIANFEQDDGGMQSDYGWSKAEPILVRGGIEALIKAARQKGGSLRYARTDALLSAGARLYNDDPDGAARINAALLDLSEQVDAFERVIYAHAAAELAAVRCDRATLEAAIQKTGASDSLRYAFWLGRFNGNVSDQITRVWKQRDSEDTRHIRQAIDGYRVINQYGYCSTDAVSVAD